MCQMLLFRNFYSDQPCQCSGFGSGTRHFREILRTRSSQWEDEAVPQSDFLDGVRSNKKSWRQFVTTVSLYPTVPVTDCRVRAKEASSSFRKGRAS